MESLGQIEGEGVVRDGLGNEAVVEYWLRAMQRITEAPTIGGGVHRSESLSIEMFGTLELVRHVFIDWTREDVALTTERGQTVVLLVSPFPRPGETVHFRVGRSGDALLRDFGIEGSPGA